MTADNTADVLAFESKALASVLTSNRELMDLYKEAADDGRIEAVRSGNSNYTLVRDDEVARRIRNADAGLRVFRIDSDGQAQPC